MDNHIQISAGTVSLTASLYENETAAAIFKALPIEGQVNRWGEEIYFSIPVRVEQSLDAREVMEKGELAFWPAGNAFCIFFGPTPVSHKDEPRAYSNVNPFGRVDGDATQFSDVKDGERITITKI